MCHVNAQVTEANLTMAFRKVDVEAGLAKLDASGWRPLRPAQLRELGLTT
ncbi:hypothetical protein GCM10022226_79170 [Sphaerisporangium flaviroseum]|uniref:Uncharacterized protein n=1 Tax=Sphaerisporangium flaviroseum TaxID=509199 RepID=A0ABP7JGW9_9ACTN